MQFEALKVFCDVARLHSFSQAAAANGITQSAASQIVRHIEERLGVELVDRSTRPLHLTVPGQTYFEGCKVLVDQYFDLEASVRRLPTEVTSSVEVAAIYSVGLRDMTQYIRCFTQQNPGTAVHIAYVHPDEVYERVLDGTSDLGVISFPRRSKGIIAHAWRDEEMVLVCPPSHALARHRSVPVERLAGERYVHFARGLTIRRHVDHYLREAGVSVDVVLEFDSVENIKNAVDAGMGIALLPLPTVEREVRAGTLTTCPLAPGGLVRPLAIIHRRAPRLSGTATRFVELLGRPDDELACQGLSTSMRRAETSHRRPANGSHRKG
jgi:DNA-binding transcriptional LysR family regulator